MLSAPPSALKSMCSTSLRSIVTLATSRKKQHAAAIGRDVDVLGDVGAEEQQRVGAVLAFDGVAAVARVPVEHVVAGAEQRDVVAVVAEDEVVAVAAEQRVVALAAEDGVVAGAAVDGQLDDAGRQGRGGDGVVAAQRVDDERVVGPFAAGDVDRAGRPTTETEVPAPNTSMMSAPLRAVDDHRVGLRRRRRPAERAGEIDVDLRHVGAGQVVDGDRVGAAERVEVDPLDVIEVHDDVADVAGEAHAPAVGRDVEVLVAVAAVEQQRVGAVLALDRVAAVAGIPLEDVVAGAEEGGVVACLPSMKSLPSPPRRMSAPLLPRMVSLPVAAVDRQLDRGRPDCRWR